MKKEDAGDQIKVAIADDHVLFRTGVKTALSMKKDIKMVAEADNGQPQCVCAETVDTLPMASVC